MKFKIKKGLIKYKEFPIEEWTGEHLGLYFRDKFLKVYGFESRRPLGQLKIYINKKNVFVLSRLEGKSINVHSNKLFCDFIDWILEYKKRTGTIFRVWLLGKREVMSDFLEARAEEEAKKRFGSVEDLQEAHKNELEKAKEHFGV